MPEPCLTIDPVAPVMIPEKFVLVLSPPKESWAAPKDTVPEPRRDPMVWLLPFKVRFEERFTCEADDKMFIEVVETVPVEITVWPP